MFKLANQADLNRYCAERPEDEKLGAVELAALREKFQSFNWADAEREIVTDRLVKFIWDADAPGSIDSGELKMMVKDKSKLRQACREFLDSMIDNQ